MNFLSKANIDIVEGMNGIFRNELIDGELKVVEIFDEEEVGFWLIIPAILSESQAPYKHKIAVKYNEIDLLMKEITEGLNAELGVALAVLIPELQKHIRIFKAFGLTDFKMDFQINLN